MNRIRKRTATKRQKSSQSGANFRRIIVAVDLSAHAEKTALYAAEFAKRVGASIILVHVFPPEPIAEFTSEQAHEAFGEGRRRTVWKLAKLIEEVRRTGVECGDDLRVGDPAEEVAQAAQNECADLIITASHHPGLLGCAVGWEQAPRIVHRAKCPVLVYHEKAA